MRVIRRMRIDSLALAISSLTAYAAGQIDSQSCYLTTTVIYGSPSNWITFSGSTSSSAGSQQSSPTFPPPVPSTAASPSATTSTALSTPFIVTVGGFGSSRARKRSSEYLTFVSGLAYLISNQDDAAVFQITPNGQMLSGGDYVGTDTHTGTSNLEQNAGIQPDGYRWSFEGTTLAFENTTFVTLQDGQVAVVFGGGTPPAGAVQVAMTAQFVDGTSSSFVIDQTSMTSLESATTSTSLGQQSQTSLGSSAGPSVKVSSSLSASIPMSSLSLSTTARSSTPLLPQTSGSTSTASSMPTTIPLSSSSTPMRGSTTTAASSVLTTSPISTTLRSSVTSLSTAGVSSTAALSSPSSSVSLTYSPLLTSQTTTAAVSTMSSKTTTQPTSSTQPVSSSASQTTTTRTTATTTTSTSSSHTTTTTRTSTISSSSPTTSAYPAKRGLAYTNVTTLVYYPPPSPYISWSYNYYSLPNASNNIGPYPSTEFKFIPLLYNDADSLTSIWSANVNFSIANYGTDAIFGFNEPDACYASKSACMPLNATLSGYQQFMQPFAGRVLIGAPAVTNSGAPDGLFYLNEFIGNASVVGLRIDFINLHWYASPYNIEYFINYTTTAYQMFNGSYPVYVSEFGMDTATYNQADVTAFMENATTWMDQQSWIVRYAWFGNFAGGGTTEYLLNSDGSGRGVLGNTWYGYQ
ncbi:hypothetical protein PV11_02836 [Exophiala sideris]|uniref:Uncharacterized protein n=1 Tax=Exophiala sideris TaxID=1016849 RepID=A0A0D1XGI7_9EURO|nr:hypothetical protein PV11_02836 [Exophiala sideris]